MDKDPKTGKFLPGNKLGSKSKRVKGIVNYIMSKTNNLIDVIDMAYDILMDKNTKPTDKIKLIEFFTDRAIGRPLQRQEVDMDYPLPIYFVEKKDAGKKGNNSN